MLHLMLLRRHSDLTRGSFGLHRSPAAIEFLVHVLEEPDPLPQRLFLVPTSADSFAASDRCATTTKDSA